MTAREVRTTMEKKKALFVAAGGRAVVDVLPLLYLQPDMVLSITSLEGWEGEKPFFDLAKGLPNTDVKPLAKVNVYDFEACMKACRELCSSYPDTEWEWIFTINSAPKSLAIAAYEIAKERGIPCWYFATQNDKFVSLVRNVEIDGAKFFHLSFREYVRTQGKRYREKPGPTKTYRNAVLGWVDIAQEMAISQDTSILTPLLFNAKKQADLSSIENVPIQFKEQYQLPLVQFLVDKEILYFESGSTYHFASKEAAQFIGTGDWLEIYVWSQAQDAQFADECLWSYSIGTSAKRPDLELDVAIMYHAQLVIAECKAVSDPFLAENNFLQNIDAVADLLGRTYVSKVFVTNQAKGGRGYETFERRAEERNIIVVTKENLQDVGKILRNAAMYPKYPRK